MANQEYIKMMEESLVKKVELLQQLQGLNLEQKEILDNYDTSPDDLDESIEKKAAIIERLDKMDEGFQNLYDKVKDELNANREDYKTEIKNMQSLIKEITDLSSSVQSQEMSNKELAKARFSYVRTQIRESRHGQKAVASYYASMMNNTGYEDSQFWDQKK